jgi:hypothetical protein
VRAALEVARPDYDVIFKDPDAALKIVTEWKKDREGRHPGEARAAR